MPVETSSLFTQVIQDHLQLRERNASLEDTMPLDTYLTQDPFDNHPLFKTEEQARLEETMDGQDMVAHAAALGWPGEDGIERRVPDVEESGLWSRSRDFDWGD
jgi:hypothetical protein